MMIDLTGLVDRAIAEIFHPPSPLIPIIFVQLDRTPGGSPAAPSSDNWMALAQLIR
jgi:hypothetical protein